MEGKYIECEDFLSFAPVLYLISRHDFIFSNCYLSTQRLLIGSQGIRMPLEKRHGIFAGQSWTRTRGRHDGVSGINMGFSHSAVLRPDPDHQTIRR